MIFFSPLRSGVLCLLWVAGTPFLFASPVFVAQANAATSPVAVESRTSSSANRSPNAQTNAQTNVQASTTLPFQAPIEDDATGALGMQGIESQYQLQLLQQDVQELRGLVEELTYQLKRMQSTQEDRYLELDSRFQQLQGQLSTGGAQTRPLPSTGTTTTNTVKTTPITAGTARERELYDTALELIDNHQFDVAITQLRAVIAQYPNGEFTANAYYWLGEVYAAKPDPDFEQARQALAQVISFFPDNRKVPDAAFKLGKVYHLMGDCKRAREILTQVVRDHQGKSAAKLAESYLRDKVGNCPAS